MSIHQISVFLENRTGQLAEITRLLAQSHVDIRAISIAETADYGVARMIVDDSRKASEILLAHGELDDVVHPAATLQVAKALEAAGKDYELLMVPGAAHSLRREPAFARKALQFLADSLL